MDAQTPEHKSTTRIVVLGGGFTGIYAVRRLEKMFARRADVQILLVSRTNFLLMTPLLFEVCSGKLEISACSISIREFLQRVDFIEATVEAIDLEQRVVHLSSGDKNKKQKLTYDHLVLALGSLTNLNRIQGSELAFTFKTLADAVLLRNHVIERMERAEVESDATVRRRELTFVVIGGGLVGVEVFGELTAFIDDVIRYYPRLRRDEIRLYLLEAGARIMPEISEELASYSTRVLSRRAGVNIRPSTPVERITPGEVHLKDEVLEASTVILSAGVTPSPIVTGLPVEKDQRGKILVEATMQCKRRPELWAAGDCASVPDPNGRPYPDLAQHAMREAKVLAENIYATINGLPVKPFEYKTKGLMASLGSHRGIAAVMGIPVRGFVAWWFRRSYYLLVTPRMAQRVRLVFEWTLAIFFPPPLSKLDLDSEKEMMTRLAV